MNIDPEQFQVIFWDFDGVLMDSNEIRDRGFEMVLKEYPKNQVEALMEFHRKNGGLSRYVKFRYFFEKLRGESVSEAEIQYWADQFSEIMLENLKNRDLLIDKHIDFIRALHRSIQMFIVSGSDQKELREICKSTGISSYFNEILGSPTPKKKLVADILEKYRYESNDCVLIGDSINDYHAAIENGISFIGVGDPELVKLSTEN